MNFSSFLSRVRALFAPPPRPATWPHSTQETHLKTSTASASKTKGTGSSRQTRASNKPAALAANDDCRREQMIAEAAYYRAERRGFAPGYEMTDWIEAEADVERLLKTIH